MISAVNLGLQFGGRVLFKDVTFRIGPRDRIGLVGSNGAGKSTLLRILVGEQTPDSGELAKAKYVNVGYLPQEGISTAGRTLYEEATSVFAAILQTQEGLNEIHRQMGRVDHESEEFGELLELYGELQHRLEASDAFRIETETKKVLTGLGFAESDFQRPTGEFSGGWQMRIALAKLLLLQPSLLLLDEPTNHLDLDSLQWLEEYLRAYDGAVMIVSHDRRFLDNMTIRTYELSVGSLTEYAGNFTSYVQLKSERLEHQKAAYRNQQQRIKQTEQFIERFRYKATKARQVQSRIKQLEKMDIVEVEEEESEIHFSFPDAPSAGKVVMTLRGIRKSYGSLQVFRDADLEIDRGERIAFVGVNGAGKSTMARIIAGNEPFDAGERIVGHNLAVSYFAQHQAEELNPQYDVLQTVEEVATGEIRKRLRTLLGCFLFRGDDVFKKVAVLSGGEKSRLALAKMLLVPSNLLVMDEPTNHLDMRSKGVLQDALREFAGTFVIVSHDRDFLDPLVTKVLEFERGHIKTYLGNISDYIASKEKERSAESVRSAERAQIGPMSDRDRKRLEAEERQRRFRLLKPLRAEIEALETRLAALEHEKGEIEQQLGSQDTYHDGERVRRISARYKELGVELNGAYYQWNELAKRLEALEQSEGYPGTKR